jgi:copper resistance protein C
MRPLTRPCGVLALAGLWLVVWCAPALAHATLIREEPAAGASLAESPDQVRLRFNEPVDAEFEPVRVYDSEGSRVDRDDARIDPDDARVLVADLESLPEGSYRVEWRITSIDGHVIEDAYAFNVTGEPESGEQAAAQGGGDQEVRQEPPPREEAGTLGGTVLYGALLFGILGLVVLAVVLLRWRDTRGIQ